MRAISIGWIALPRVAGAAATSLPEASLASSSASEPSAAAAPLLPCSSDKRRLARMETRSSRLISLTGDPGTPTVGRAVLCLELACFDIATLNFIARGAGRGRKRAMQRLSIRAVRCNRQLDVRAVLGV